ncbi:MAG: penicillin-binding protein activator [Desulfobacterales bacterium]|jgi:ABC-type branched-subunit amino acid transport system substrate-binding protein
MKRHHFIIIFSLVAVLCACAPKPGMTPSPTPAGSADELFLNAETQFQAKFYMEALSLYQEYLVQFSQEPMAPAALMKIGIINSILGEYEDARQAYQRLIWEYPGSLFAEDAKVEILVSFYKQGRYEEVLTAASSMLVNLKSLSSIFKTYALLGDTYLAVESPIDAIQYYLEAQKRSTPLEQAAIDLKIKEAIAQLDTDDVAILLDSSEARLPMDYLLFQLGLNYAMEEQYGDALKVLEEFVERYPQHENVSLALSLQEEIRKNALFQRYTLGCLLPLSGPYQTFGMRALKGIELAMVNFSALSGNSSVNIIVKDTGANPAKTLQALQELNEEQVAAIIGPIVTAKVAAEEAQARGIPIITITQKDNIASIGENVFRNFITPQMQVQALADYTINSLGLSHFAILYPDENYGDTFMNLFWDQLNELGGTVVGVEAYNPEHTDFADPIKKLVGLYYPIPEDLKPEIEALLKQNEENQTGLQASEDQPSDKLDEDAQQADEEDEEPQPIVDFDAIFIPDAPKKAGLIIPQLAYYDVDDVLLLGTNLWHSESLIKMARQYVQGAIMPDAFFLESDSPQVRQFVEQFEETYQEKPGFVEAVIYDSAMLLLDILNKPHIRFRSELRDELFNLFEYQGVTGATRFDENGDAQKKLQLLTIKGRRFVEVE